MLLLFSDRAELRIGVPASTEGYACASGNYNPIRVSQTFASCANFSRTVTHEIFSSAAARARIETWAVENKIAKVRYFFPNFVGMMRNDNTKI